MTCHNEEKYIAQAINSVIAQTAYEYIDEIIVVNDGSTDSSGKILDEIEKNNNNVKVINTDGVGVSAARNLAIKHSIGKLIAFLDGDDVWNQMKLEKQLYKIDKQENIGFVYCDFFDFTKTDLSDAVIVRVNSYTPQTKDYLKGYFLNDGPIIPSMMLVKKEVFEKAGSFDESLVMSEDTDLCFRIGQHYCFSHITEGLLYKRRHNANVTGNLEKFVDVYDSLTEKFINMEPSLRKFRKKRLARNYAKIGNDCIRRGKKHVGGKYLFKAIRYNPIVFRTYCYLFLSTLPIELSKSVISGFKSIYHRRWRSHA